MKLENTSLFYVFMNYYCLIFLKLHYFNNLLYKLNLTVYFIKFDYFYLLFLFQNNHSYNYYFIYRLLVKNFYH